MPLPNFLVIGAAKSGTSALYRYLQQHPDIYMSPVKEPHFFGYEGEPPNAQGPGDFVNNAITDIVEYARLFDNVTTHTAIGEASPTYIHLPKALDRIRHYVPDAKLIAILRQPADRAFSAYMHTTRDRLETAPNFKDALAREDERIEKRWGPIWHYKQNGFYYGQLKPYFDAFDNSQIRIHLHDEMVKDPVGVLQDIFRFLEVDSEFQPKLNIRANVSGVPKNKFVSLLIEHLFQRANPIRFVARRLINENTRWRFTAFIRNRNIRPQRIPTEIRNELTDLYREDIQKLQGLINRDLSHWLEDR